MRPWRPGEHLDDLVGALALRLDGVVLRRLLALHLGGLVLGLGGSVAAGVVGDRQSDREDDHPDYDDGETPVHDELSVRDWRRSLTLAQPTLDAIQLPAEDEPEHD
jgi:hypothetical protein